MNAPLEMTEHIRDNELAAIVEHGIERADRTVVEHLAECGECSEALMMASEVDQEMKTEDNVEHPDFRGGRAGWKVLASAAALAAALFVVFGAPLRERWFGPKGTEALAEASKSVELRATEGRLHGFPYQERRVTRSLAPDEPLDLDTYKVDHEAAEILAKPEADPHATGVAYLLLHGGRGNAHADVTVYFEKALAQATPEQRPAVVNDYAVALIKRGSDADLALAWTLLEEQWRKEQTPEIGFNRALVLEFQQRDREAITAWDDYLRLDGDSQWAEAARKKKDFLLQLNPELRRP